MNVNHVCNGSFAWSSGGSYSVKLPLAIGKKLATVSKTEMQLSPFLVCNIKYFYSATNSIYLL